VMQFGTRRIASPHSLGSTASSGKWNRMGAHCPCSEARRYPTRSTRTLASMTALYDAKRARLNNKLTSPQLRRQRLFGHVEKTEGNVPGCEVPANP